MVGTAQQQAESKHRTESVNCTWRESFNSLLTHFLQQDTPLKLPQIAPPAGAKGSRLWGTLLTQSTPLHPTLLLQLPPPTTTPDTHTCAERVMLVETLCSVFIRQVFLTSPDVDSGH